MTDYYSEEETIATISLLSATRLKAFMRADAVRPIHGDSGLVFRQIDLARLELLCDLSEHFELGEDALGIVLSLVDQLHCARSELRVISEAIECEPQDVRSRIGEALRRLSVSVPDKQ